MRSRRGTLLLPGDPCDPIEDQDPVFVIPDQGLPVLSGGATSLLVPGGGW